MKRSILYTLALFLPVFSIILLAQNRQNQKLRLAEMAINQLYVDTVNEDKLVEDAIKGMLEKLDPHSAYTSAEETRKLNEPLEGNFSGIGISFNMQQDTLRVISTVAGGPSERVGVLAGDRIIAVNDSVIAGKNLDTADIMKRLRGPKGTKVDIKVLRQAPGSRDTIDFSIVRAEIPIYSVDAAYMADPHTGYIRVNKFAAETAKEVREAIEKLKSNGMKQLILDLTDNGGGFLNASVDLLGEFLQPGQLTVYTEGRASARHDNPARPKGKKPLFSEGRLVVMTNQYSASASEITAGAIQDWDRGLVVGRRSYGKGLVQRPIPFPDGSMMRLTVAHYFTPAGRNIQKPYVMGDQKSYALDILDRFNRGELMHEDSVKYDESTRTETLVLKRPIYGGGGIYPDKFVGLDTTENTRYYRDLTAKGLILRVAASYADSRRKEIKKQYKNSDDFVERFKVPESLLKELYDLGESEKVKFNEAQAELSKPLIEMILKGLIGRDIFDDGTYFKVYNRHDPIFREALRLINSSEYDRLLSAPESGGEAISETNGK